MLTDVRVAKLKYEGERGDKLRIEKHPDRDGLYLAVSPPRKDDPRATYGSKVWRYEFRWPPTAAGKRQTLTYGKYPELSLAEAREKHLEARKTLANGANPAEQKQEQKRARLEALGNTYGSIAAKWYEVESQGKSKAWKGNHKRWLDVVNKKLEHRPIGSINEDDVIAAIRPFEDDGFVFSADRARAQVAQVFAYAIRKRLHSGNNPAANVKGEIRVPEHKNNAHIKAKEIPEFLKAVDSANYRADQSKRATRLLLLTFTRKQELLAAKWGEIDLDGAVWEIPAERMKNRLPHIVPLSRQAVELFKQQRETSKGDYVFPNTQKRGKHVGLSTLNVFFDRIGYTGDRLTPHGLRAVASTELNGSGAFRGEVIEIQLSHRERNKVRASYNKADYLEERKRLMQFWADRVDQLCAGAKPEDTNVIQLQTKAA